ncbi:outer membrane beta-barrel protein [Rhodoferax sp.]|jgi:opacity protein-like surface antigen|uniref:outer membrane beta-barrel protein n=1 Tax=Rhodoferax sp. TaxID=50421 RepID=UPI00272FB655|nr:outer membrane beta-barrel protein [Rhodoferax sp.]MDP1530246.1 outer membrane beta-barrel protein [Rhodoferax sp.]MDP1943407.1 outer membrane beta-barrel protein [Rhodoferax sp.]MDP2442614.1 outer membrane beta-barrel protein [Rhodoferax sp.]MDP3189838.1 outer membrane beta-barrel protein [Rhodoferax sp.]MDP3336599.1 outer membrane beta-barrel protein [Rhodoferax sp.]
MKKLNFTRLLISAAVCTVAMSAQAQSGFYGLTAPGSSYVELGIGQSDYSVGNGSGLFDSEDGDTAYSIRGGSFFNANLGMEIGYTNFGKINRAGGTTKAEGINLSLVGKMPLSPSFNVLGKIGTTYSHTNVSSLDPSVAAGSEKDFGLSYGIGAEYLLTPQWSGVLQYESTKMQFAGDRSDRVGLTSLSARYRF